MVAGSSGYNSSQARTIDLFWKNFYSKNFDSISNKSTSQQPKVTLYHNAVIKELIDSKRFLLSLGEYFSEEELLDLQNKIEDLTMNFDENSVFKSFRNLIPLLICRDMITAKEQLIKKGLYEKDEPYIHVLGRYTLEAVMIHVLGSVFNCLQDLSVVRVSTLIQQIDSIVRV